MTNGFVISNNTTPKYDILASVDTFLRIYSQHFAFQDVFTSDEVVFLGGGSRMLTKTKRVF